jgi:uridine kinase
MSPERQHVLETVANALLAARRVDRALRVVIDGRSAAGKTTFADELARTLRNFGAVTLRASIDEFHPAGYSKESRGWSPEEYISRGFDYQAFRELFLDPLGPQGNGIARLRFHQAASDRPYPAEWVTASPQTVAIADAGFAFVPALEGSWDVSIWLHISFETMVTRAMERDVAWVGNADVVHQRYVSHWIPTHQLYEERYSGEQRADWLIDNEDFERPAILKSSAEAAEPIAPIEVSNPP